MAEVEAEGEEKDVKLSEKYKECVELGETFYVGKDLTRPDIDLSKA